MGYRPQPKRRSCNLKPGSEKGRPLDISCFEDKLVELAVKRVLELIYETVFEGSSYGYRPVRSQHQCLDALGRTIQRGKVNRVVASEETVSASGPSQPDSEFEKQTCKQHRHSHPAQFRCHGYLVQNRESDYRKSVKPAISTLARKCITVRLHKSLRAA